jgi:hypothetical protein
VQVRGPRAHRRGEQLRKVHLSRLG